MIVTTSILKEKFLECKEKYFKGMKPLPTPRFWVMHGFKILAQFRCELPSSRKGRIYLQRIGVTDSFDFDETMLTNLMVHEMIHYYLYYHKIKDDGEHGEEFMKIAKRMNNDDGLDIVSEGTYDDLKASPKVSKFRWKLYKFFGK